MQVELDRQDTIESPWGWCKDRWGLWWQITPKRLLEFVNGPDRDAASCDGRDDENEEDRYDRDRTRSGGG